MPGVKGDRILLAVLECAVADQLGVYAPVTRVVDILRRPSAFNIGTIVGRLDAAYLVQESVLMTAGGIPPRTVDAYINSHCRSRERCEQQRNPGQHHLALPLPVQVVRLQRGL